MGEEQAKEFDYTDAFYSENWNKLQEAMIKSELIIFTHEHWDHTGGLAKSRYLNDLTGRVILTKEQVESPLLKEAGFPLSFINKINPLNYKEYYKVAPGIVLIKAPGHTPGSQMIYVRLQNGNEFLFTGDIVWNFTGIEKLKNRPFFVTLIGGEDCIKLGHLIRWLYDEIYMKEKPNIRIIPCHDPEIIDLYIEKGILSDDFEL
jgi:glyoxylase-like metal-dependent hydrolase (beta-lactamase superfamily II)